MSSDNEDQCLPTSLIKSTDEPQKQSQISYTRDFLLSFSELETCKRVPSGFDISILSKFQEASESIPEWRRIPGSLSFQSSKRVEHVSAPTTRIESSGTYSRGSHDRNVWQGSGSALGHGRWESRSSSNDKDGDQQSDRDSVTQDSGRRYGHQSRHAWQSPEHDGLLGSGSFPRPSGSTGGPLSPKVQGSGQYHLNRSTEPYHPPRPYKAANYSRRDTTDSFNDETFGSMECSGQDRAEEERMRRESFELMRKEQQKVLQEKQRHIPNKQIDPNNLDIAANLEKSVAAEILQSENSRMLEDFASLDSQDHRVCPTQAPASRPLVPPGFATNILEKNLGAKSSLAPQDGKSELVENNVYIDGVAVERDTDIGSDILAFVGPIEKTVTPLLSTLEISESSLGTDIIYENNPHLKEANKRLVDGTVRVEEEHSTSILEKLFGNALAVDDDGGLPGFIEHQSVVADKDTWHPHSSNFSDWFLEQGDNELSSSKEKDILSLFVNNEKGSSQVSEENIPLENYQTSQGKLITTSAATPDTVSIINEPFHDSEKPGMRSGVLTCEDLEQSILAEVVTSSSLQVGPWSVLDVKVDEQKVDVDDLASQHLLSLLHKGSGMKDHTPPSFFMNQETKPPGGLGIGEITSICEVDSSASETLQNPEQILTLETLFGTAFMNELHSMEAPLSSQRGLEGGGLGRTDDALEPLGLPFPVVNDGLAHLAASDSVSGHWLGFDDPATKGSKLPGVLGFQHNRPERTLEIQLPEEETLITIGEPVNTETSRFIMPVGHVQKKPEDLEMADKLATLNAIFEEDRSAIPGFNFQPRPPAYNNNLGDSEILHRNLVGRLAPQQHPHFPMDHHLRPLYQQHLDEPHRNQQQLKFIGQENFHHPFPPNIFHHPFHNHPGGPRFNPHSLLHQQAQASSANFLPPPLLQGMPQPINHAGGGYMPELINPMQGFPFNQRPPNYGGPRMIAMPGSGGGGEGTHPDALERFIEMELRANSNKKLPVPGFNMGGINGSETDIAGFRYR